MTDDGLGRLARTPTNRTCTECGAATTLAICDPCRLRIMHRLGMPIGINWCHVRVWVDGPNRSLREVTFPVSEDRARTYGISTPITAAATKRWAKYEATLFGLGLDPNAPMTGDPGRLWPCHIPDLGIAAVQLWRMTAQYDRSPIRAEWRWHPEYGAEPTISGPVNEQRRKDDVERAHKGFALLLSLQDEGGRPEVSREARIDRLAHAGLRWLAGHPYHSIEETGRSEWSEAISGSDASTINKLMERPPSFKNADVYRRMHEIRESEYP